MYVAESSFRNNAPNVWIVRRKGWGEPILAECLDQATARQIAQALNVLEELDKRCAQKPS